MKQWKCIHSSVFKVIKFQFGIQNFLFCFFLFIARIFFKIYFPKSHLQIVEVWDILTHLWQNPFTSHGVQFFILTWKLTLWKLCYCIQNLQIYISTNIINCLVRNTNKCIYTHHNNSKLIINQISNFLFITT